VKVRNKVLIAILSFIIVFVLADKLIDRTPIVQSVLDDMTRQAPYSLTIAKLEHSFLAPGELNLEQFVFEDEFGNQIDVESVNLKVDIWALFKKIVHVEQVDITAVSANLSEQGLNQLSQSLVATEQAPQTDEAQEPLPIDRIEVADFSVTPVDLTFRAQQGSIELKKLNLNVSQVQVLQAGQFDLNTVSALLKLNSPEMSALVQNLQDPNDQSKLEIGLTQLDLALDINQTQPAQVTLQKFNLAQANITADLGQIENEEQNAIEQASEEVKEVGEQAVSELVELPLNLFIQLLDIDSINLLVHYQNKNYQVDDLSVALKDWALTDDKLFVVEKLKGQLDLAIARVSQTPAEPVKMGATEPDNITSEAEVAEGTSNPSVSSAASELVLPFDSQLEINNIQLTLDMNQTQAEQLTVSNLSLETLDFELVLPQSDISNSPVENSNQGEASQANSEQTANGQDSNTQAPATAIELPVNLKVEQIAVKQLNGELIQGEQKLEISDLAFKLNQAKLTQNKQIILNKITADTQLSVSKINALNYQADTLEARAKIEDGLINLTQFAFNAFGGTLDLSASAHYLAPYKVTLNHFKAADLKTEIALANPAASETTQDAEVSKPGDEGQAEKPESEARIELVESLNVNQIELNNINLKLIDPDSEKPWLSLQNFVFNLNQLALIRDHKILNLDRLQAGTDIKLNLANLNYRGSDIDLIHFDLQTLERGFQFSDSGFMLDKGKLLANAKLTKGDSKINTESDINWSELNLAELDAFVKELPIKPKGLISGQLKSNLNFAPTAQNVEDIDGDILLNTTNFELSGIALDKIVDGFRSSQETSLLDVGAFMVSGPLGVVAMNFAQLGSGAAQFSGQTKIEQINLDSQIADSVIQVKSAEIKTKKNRLGFQGKVDLAKSRFNKLKFGILDDEGCASIRQTLDGPFGEIKDLLFSTTTGAVTSPLSSVFNQAANLANGGKCKPFFAK